MISKMIIGNKEFDVANHTYVCGILNVTPDSFSDGGNFINKDKALFRVEQMIKEGAHIIDVGGESTRPGYTQISDDDEIDRVCNIIELIKKNFDIPVSIDTYKSKVFYNAHKSGADMLNDIWGLKYDNDMAAMVKQSEVAVCLMHNSKEAIYGGNTKDEVVAAVCKELKESVDIALNAGVAKEKICLDPGIGFGKTYEMNLWMLKEIDTLKELGYPVYIGASRKSMIGIALDAQVDDRLFGTIATTVMATMKNASFIRVHDIKENVQAIKMIETIMMS